MDEGALETGPDGRKIITIALDDPEPDPPDAECVLCGGAVPGWRAKFFNRLAFCDACEGPTFGFPQFRGLGFEQRWDHEHRVPELREAACTLFNLEAEIDRQEARNRHA